jgi:hypothetical protein
MVAPKRVRAVERAPETGVVTATLSDGDLRYLKGLADKERAREREELAIRVAKSKAVVSSRQNRAKVAAFAAKVKTMKGSD